MKTIYIVTDTWYDVTQRVLAFKTRDDAMKKFTRIVKRIIKDNPSITHDVNYGDGYFLAEIDPTRSVMVHTVEVK